MKAKRVKKLDPKQPLADNAARIVRVRLAEMRSFVPGALHPKGVKDQHDMRIAVKRLRYVLEATGFCFGRAADEARRRARDLQDVLGELHDCDIMLPRVERHVAALREDDALAVRMWAGDGNDLGPELAAHAPHRTSYRGLEVLLVYLQARRTRALRPFLRRLGQAGACGYLGPVGTGGGTQGGACEGTPPRRQAGRASEGRAGGG